MMIATVIMHEIFINLYAVVSHVHNNSTLVALGGNITHNLPLDILI